MELVSEGTGGPTEFESLILRAGCNNTWLHWNSTERKQGDYLRDQWMRDSYAAMGHPSARGLFVHLYLNGLYWGIYNLTERPDEHFAAAHGGGKAKDYDARNGENVLSGDENAWKKLFASANAGFLNGHELADFQALLDLPAFIDFMILNHYGANNDWDHAPIGTPPAGASPPALSCFLSGTANAPWKALKPTPCLSTMISVPRGSSTSSPNPRNSGWRLATGCIDICRGEGRWRRKQPPNGSASCRNFFDSAIVAESARWGDYRRDVHRYKVEPYNSTRATTIGVRKSSGSSPIIFLGAPPSCSSSFKRRSFTAAQSACLPHPKRAHRPFRPVRRHLFHRGRH